MKFPEKMLEIFSRLVDKLICFRSLPPLVAILAGRHHHFTELVEVHGPAAVLVNLGDDAVQVLLGQVGVNLGHDGSELSHRDETLK